jgi:hypothetical protein
MVVAKTPTQVESLVERIKKSHSKLVSRMFIEDMLLFFNAHGRRLGSNWICVHELFQSDQIKDDDNRQNKGSDILWFEFPNGESIVVERH